jgi:hypothetical protein
VDRPRIPADAPPHAGWPLLLGIALLAACGGHTQVPGGKDELSVRKAGHALVIEVRRSKGIGSVEVARPGPGWPAAVLVRLRDFPDLESFRAATSAATLACARIRPEGEPPRQDCSLDGKPIAAIRQVAGTFEVTLPAALFAGGPPAVSLSWVDQWR